VSFLPSLPPSFLPLSLSKQTSFRILSIPTQPNLLMLVIRLLPDSSQALIPLHKFRCHSLTDSPCEKCHKDSYCRLHGEVLGGNKPGCHVTTKWCKSNKRPLQAVDPTQSLVFCLNRKIKAHVSSTPTTTTTATDLNERSCI
jgi:hypothetical protein